MIHVVYIMGCSGCGKSTVGDHLAKLISGIPDRRAVFLDGDDYHSEESRRRMASGIPLTDADRLPWLHAIRDDMHHRVEAWETAPDADAYAGQYVIVACSALKPSYRAILRDEAEHPRPEEGINAKHRVDFVYLDAPQAVLEARVGARTGHYMHRNMVASQIQTLELPAPDQTNDCVITVDATKPIEEVVRSAATQLDVPTP